MSEPRGEQLRDTRGMALNVLGTALMPCSYDPLTGWLRDGCCHTDEHDGGSHVICCKVTVEFLNFQMERGNDLITPRPELRFRGLKPGVRWCVCALRWREAYEAGCAPAAVLESTHVKALDYVLVDWLRRSAVKSASSSASRAAPMAWMSTMTVGTGSAAKTGVPISAAIAAVAKGRTNLIDVVMVFGSDPERQY